MIFANVHHKLVLQSLDTVRCEGWGYHSQFLPAWRSLYDCFSYYKDLHFCLLNFELSRVLNLVFQSSLVHQFCETHFFKK